MKQKVLKRWRGITCTAILGVMLAGSVFTTEVQAATASEKSGFREEFVKMLITGDGSVHNIRKYNLTFSEYYAIVNDVEKKEGKLPYMCYRNQTTQSTKDGNYMNTFWMYSSDSGFTKRYQGLKKALSEVQEKISPEMTDLEKVLVCHDYVVNCTTYKNTNDSYCRMAVGPLSLGYGVCVGYAEALKFLLEQENIECKLVDSDTMSHCWLAVKIEGEWYHVDPTWDDTRSKVKGEVAHNFLMRNDREFKTASSNSHKGWNGVVSESEAYEDWYVHDVQGDMLYNQGNWYYIDNGSIVKNDIEGDAYKLVVAGENLKLQDVTDGVISYVENGEEYVAIEDKQLIGSIGGSNSVLAPKPTVTATKKPTATATPKPTATATPKPTATPRPTATATPRPTATATPKPTATATPEPTATATPVPVNSENKNTPLQWIEVKKYNTNAYFNTGIVMKNSYKFQYTFQLTNENCYDNLFWCIGTDGTKMSLKQNAKGGIAGGYSWYIEKLANTQTQTPMRYTKDYNKLYIDDTLVKVGPLMDYTCNTNLVFGTGRSRIYAFKIWDERGIMLRDYIPVLDEKGQPCMYDKVQKEYTYYTGNGLEYQVASEKK